MRLKEHLRYFVDPRKKTLQYNKKFDFLALGQDLCFSHTLHCIAKKKEAKKGSYFWKQKQHKNDFFLFSRRQFCY